MTEEFYRKVTDLHNELVETEVLIQRLKDLDDEEEWLACQQQITDYRLKKKVGSLAALASLYLHTIHDILRNTSVIAQLQMVLQDLQCRFEAMK